MRQPFLNWFRTKKYFFFVEEVVKKPGSFLESFSREGKTALVSVAAWLASQKPDLVDQTAGPIVSCELSAVTFRTSQYHEDR